MNQTGAPTDASYDARVQQQIQQFVDQPIHGLPDIFHVWSHYSLGPGIREVFEVESVNDFYKRAVHEACVDRNRESRILSIGCGDGDVEIELAKSLLEEGFRSFVIEGADISPVLIDRFSEKVQSLDLHRFIKPTVVDVNKTKPASKFDVVMANHSLHHIVELESTFDTVFECLNDTGILVTSDMIGRNGHMRWPETKALLDIFWPLLSEKQKYHHQLQRLDIHEFVDHDCSGEGFEGIRAQDILYEILQRFHPYRFLGFGGFIDILVDRGYGHGFDANDEKDRSFIIAMSQLNNLLLDAGVIKPTLMMAYFTKEPREEIYFKSRSALRSLRLPFDNPEWL